MSVTTRSYLNTGLLLFGLWLTTTMRAQAQQIGDCPRAQSDAYLDAGNVRARILNNGGLFYRGEPHVYEVPKGSGSNSIFAANIWVAGYIDGALRGAATRYGEWEFWPGPLDANGNPPVDCEPYDRIWEINRRDFEMLRDEQVVSDNMKNWPWDLGAPVLDRDGNPDNYNVAGGDRPALLGDQMLWWVMNDRGNIHESTGGEPIGLEVHGTAFAFEREGFGGNTTLYRFRLVNKNEADLSDAYFAFFMDTDLGDLSDDYVGSDSLLHLGFTYNTDNEDISGEGYGTPPPALGITYLETALSDTDGFDNDRNGVIDESGEMLGMTSMMTYFGGGGVNEEPIQLIHYYQYMLPVWKDNTPVLEGMYGYYDERIWPDGLPRNPTRFFYTGNPVTQSYWSQFNLDSAGRQSDPSDRRFVVSSGPFNLAAGEMQDISVAIVWSQGKDHLDSVTQLKKDVSAIRDVADFLLAPAAITEIDTLHSDPAPPPRFVVGFDQNFPNPFSESTSIRYSLPEDLAVRLAVFDVLGREVALLVDEMQEAGVYEVQFEANDLPAGLYMARLEMGFLQFTKKMIRSR